MSRQVEIPRWMIGAACAHVGSTQYQTNQPHRPPLAVSLAVPARRQPYNAITLRDQSISGPRLSVAPGSGLAVAERHRRVVPGTTIQAGITGYSRHSEQSHSWQLALVVKARSGDALRLWIAIVGGGPNDKNIMELLEDDLDALRERMRRRHSPHQTAPLQFSKFLWRFCHQFRP